MKKPAHRFLHDASGATAVEYGLIVAGIALAILAAMQGVGARIAAVLTTVSTF